MIYAKTGSWPNEVDFALEYLKDKLLEQSRVMQASEDSGEYSADKNFSVVSGATV